MTATIFAVSSGAPPAALAVVRISGPAAIMAGERLTGTLPPPRRAGLRTLRTADGMILDHGLVLVFPGPDTATGDDLVELHIHGGRAGVRAVLDALGDDPALTAAEPGGFTRRALENGRIDLLAAEALGDLLAAETQAQHRAAVRAGQGGLRRMVEAWTMEAVRIAAWLEATIDHSDADDEVDEAAIMADVRRALTTLHGQIAAALATPPAERLRDGIRVVFAGPPNAGKSSLFNRMAGREAAIVTPIAGTTRDRIEAPVIHGGVAWLLIDTAGLAEGVADAVEAIGIERSRDAMAQADVVLWLGDAPPPTGAIAVHARCNLPDRMVVPAGRVGSHAGHGGDDGVWSALHSRAVDLLPADDAVALNERHRAALRDIVGHLREATEQRDPLFVADGLGHVLRGLDRLTGRAHTENVLDALFAGFCLGK